jgi:hypothetical protein
MVYGVGAGFVVFLAKNVVACLCGSPSVACTVRTLEYFSSEHLELFRQ